MAQPLLPGTRWVSKRGKHAGLEVEIDHVSDISVFYKTLGGQTADNWGKGKTDESKTNRLAVSSFRSLYAAKGTLVDAETKGGVSFRRIWRAKPKVQDELPAASPPLTLNGYVMTGGTPLNIEVIEITPDMARAWLDRGGRNRKVSERLVSRLASAIRRGEWMLTGDSIKLDEAQQIIDGQHRLHAIVMAGIPVTSLVVRNVGNAAQNVIDTGRPRQPMDVLAMHGFPSTPAMAAAARILIIYEYFGKLDVSSRQVNLLISNATILAYAEAHREELIHAIHLADSVRSAGLAGGTGLLGAAITILLRKDAQAAEQFCEALQFGADLAQNSPILKLRNRLMNERREARITTTVADRQLLLALIFRAWNAWRRGETMNLLIWRESNEPFPEPI